MASVVFDESLWGSVEDRPRGGQDVTVGVGREMSVGVQGRFRG